jgi:hypothetical protein
MLTLAALIDDVEQIVASHTEYEWAGPSIWRVWAFTASGLAHVSAEFAPDSYDAVEDRQRRRPGSMDKPVDPTSLVAWVRPFGTATSFGVTRVHHHTWSDHVQSHEEFIPLEIAIGFGNVLERIGIRARFDDQSKRDRWAAFVDAARNAALT